jgi:hypothetical protein
MKVIFLDIDGVLNTPATPRPITDSRTVDPVLLDRLNTLLQETHSVVVLTSTWRHDPGGWIAGDNSVFHLRTLCPICDPNPAMRKSLRGAECSS